MIACHCNSTFRCAPIQIHSFQSAIRVYQSVLPNFNVKVNIPCALLSLSISIYSTSACSAIVLHSCVLMLVIPSTVYYKCFSVFCCYAVFYFCTNTCMFQTFKDTHVQWCMHNQMCYITSTTPEHYSKRISIFAAVPIIHANTGYSICVSVLVW